MYDTVGFHSFQHTQAPKILFVDSRDAQHRVTGESEFTCVFEQAIQPQTGRDRGFAPVDDAARASAHQVG